MVIMDDATSIITTRSPYIVRVSMTLPQITQPMAQWAAMIDPDTRDIVQTVYIRKVEKVGGSLYNVEFDKFPDQKDPGK